MSTENIQSTSTKMADHPDIAAMSARYERASETATAQATDTLTVLAGLFVAAAPWIAGFSESALATVNLITGLAIAVLGAGFAAFYERTHRLTWACPLLGAWTIVSVWTVVGAEATTAVVLSNVIGGGVVALLGLGAMLPMFTARRTAR
jgi:hypothetical protein